MRIHARVAPGVRALSRRDRVAFREATRDFDNLWLAWWPLASGVSVGDQRLIVWDWDALSLSAFTAAKANVRTSPPRAIARCATWLSFELFERIKLRGLDFVTTTSAHDQAWLRRRGVRARLLRNVVDLGAFATARSAVVEASKIVVFIGSDYEPNVHGLRWFLRHVWPSVAATVPGSRLMVAGRGLDHIDLDSSPSVEILGEVADVAAPLAASQLAVAPIFYGAGVPYKLLEYAAAGRTAVITPHCGAALGRANGFTIARGRRDWIAQLVRLLQTPSLAQAEGDLAYEYVSAEFSNGAFAADVANLEERLSRS